MLIDMKCKIVNFGPGKDGFLDFEGAPFDQIEEGFGPDYLPLDAFKYELKSRMDDAEIVDVKFEPCDVELVDDADVSSGLMCDTEYIDKAAYCYFNTAQSDNSDEDDSSEFDEFEDIEGVRFHHLYELDIWVYKGLPSKMRNYYYTILKKV